MTPDAKLQRLRELLLEYSYQEKEVKLASGRLSHFYFDGKQTSLHPEGAALIGELMLKSVLRDFPEAKAVGGPTLGADPLAASVAVLSFQQGRPLFSFIVRKEPKGHGTMNWIEGARHLQPGMNVVLLEDVITTGGSLIRAAERVRKAGLNPIGVVVLVDREEGGREALEENGLKVTSLLTKTQLLGG